MAGLAFVLVWGIFLVSLVLIEMGGEVLRRERLRRKRRSYAWQQPAFKQARVYWKSELAPHAQAEAGFVCLHSLRPNQPAPRAQLRHRRSFL